MQVHGACQSTTWPPSPRYRNARLPPLVLLSDSFPIQSDRGGHHLADKAALITGGSSGIGLAIARALGEDGFAVTIAARRPDKLEQAAEELRAAGLDVH